MSIATTASLQCGCDPTGVRGIATARQPQLRFNAAADATRERCRAGDPDAASQIGAAPRPSRGRP